MKRLFIFIFLLFTLFFIVLLIEFSKIEQSFSILNKKIPQILLADSDSILVLGKLGNWRYGGENTDAIFVVHLRDDKVYIIHIPRDLLVALGNDIYKINSLYSFKKIKELLFEVSKFTGLRVKKYIVIDIYFVREIVDLIGGLEVELKYPVTDALTGYTLYPGKYKLTGEWVEFVLRSRFYPTGDFVRMKNQFIIIKAFKKQFDALNQTELFKVLMYLLSGKAHYETNMSYKELLQGLTKISKINPENFKEIFIDYDKNYWVDGYFNIKINAHYGQAYGLYPKNGIGEYSTIREYIKKEIYQKISPKH